MIEQNQICFFWTEAPLHAGSGDTTLAIDLPIQRERHTGHPIVQASGVKGALRDHCRRLWGVSTKASTPLDDATKLLFSTFGPETGGDYGGSVSFSDARLLLFPVRSLRGICAWITCPYALALFARHLAQTGLGTAFPSLTGFPVEGTVWVTPMSPVSLTRLGAVTVGDAAPSNSTVGDAAPSNPQVSGAVVLEEYTLAAQENANVQLIASWIVQNALPTSPAYAYWKNLLHGQTGSHLVILHDDDFKALVETATDVAQRISVENETGTVKNTGLWTEENLPCDSLLYTVCHAMMPRSGKETPPSLIDNGRPSASKVLSAIADALNQRPIVQIGGDETVGRGIVRTRLFPSPVASAGAVQDVATPAISGIAS